jgi:hypothetical protein
MASSLAAETIDLNDPAKLQLFGTAAEIKEYRGRKAVRVTPARTAEANSSIAVIRDLPFTDGTIEVDVAGAPAAGAGEGARGFIGIAFRVQDKGEKFEYIYLRPTNGRADDQVRRNHSVQYSSHPDYPWMRLRKESPEKYESYVDLEPGVWTAMKIVVAGRQARLYVHGATQPCLIVNDLKLDAASGGVGLWVGPGTDGYFSNLRVSR